MAKVSGRSSTATRSLARGTAQWPLCLSLLLLSPLTQHLNALLTSLLPSFRVNASSPFPSLSLLLIVPIAVGHHGIGLVQ